VRPSGIESIRAIQSALADLIAPALTSPFALDAAQTLQMLLESLAADWDSAADQLRRDNETLAELLMSSREAIKSASDGNESFAAAVSEIEQRLSEDVADSIAIPALSSRNDALRGTLEQTLMAFEDITAEQTSAAITSVRGDIYGHLRDVASRGWSFWDVSSFRAKMTAIRAAARDDAPYGRGVE
jgi:predicted  nucleic acid-binding Zn-ribbon protein